MGDLRPLGGRNRASQSGCRCRGCSELSVSDVYWDVLTFVETKLFSKLVREYLPDDEYSALQQALIANPESGDLVRGSGGVRSCGGTGSVEASVVAFA